MRWSCGRKLPGYEVFIKDLFSVDFHTLAPPSTTRCSPVINEASSEAKNNAA